MLGMHHQNTKKKPWQGLSAQFRCSVMSDSLRTHEHQASLFITNSRSLLKLMSIASVMPSNHLNLCRPLLLPPSIFTSQPSGSFPMSQFFASGDQSIGISVSASVLPMNIQGWIPLWLTGWISLLYRELSKVFSSTTVWKHPFFGTQASLWSTSHIDTWLL